MDHWVPVVRWAHDGVAPLVADLNGFSAIGNAAGRKFGVTATSADNAAHGSPDAWVDAYGELQITNTIVGSANIRWGCWLRVADSSNCYTLQCDGGSTFTINKVVAGTPTTLLTTSFTLNTLSAPATFRAEIQGDQLRGFWRGRLMGTVSDSTFADPGFVSMFARVVASATELEIARFESGPLGVSYSPGVDVQQAGPNLRHARLR